MNEVLRLEDVTVVRGDVAILEGIAWDVQGGDRWVVMGPNGAGKTTLMALCAARFPPTSGSAVVLGESLLEANIQELRTRVGLSSAALADRIPPDETVRNLVMTAAYGVLSRQREEYEEIDERRADDLLAAFGIHAFADRTFETLSEGERKRVQIARALMADPELLLLDEPAAGLDLGGREELLAALTEIAGDRRSPALVLVTHHVEEVPVGFTHALLLRAGRIVAAGPLRETLTSENLSVTYDLPVELHEHEGRYTVRRAS